MIFLCKKHNACASLFKVVPVHVPLLNHSNLYASPFQRFGISSFASPQTDEKETSQTGNEQGSTGENNDAATKESGEAEVSDKKEESGTYLETQNINRSVKKKTKQTTFFDSDSDSGEDLSMDDLVKLVAEKEELLKTKHKEIEQMQDKVLRTYAEMENVMDRTRREAENSKKFAIQVCLVAVSFK